MPQLQPTINLASSNLNRGITELRESQSNGSGTTPAPLGHTRSSSTHGPKPGNYSRRDANRLVSPESLRQRASANQLPSTTNSPDKDRNPPKPTYWRQHETPSLAKSRGKHNTEITSRATPLHRDPTVSQLFSNPLCNVITRGNHNRLSRDSTKAPASTIASTTWWARPTAL